MDFVDLMDFYCVGVGGVLSIGGHRLCVQNLVLIMHLTQPQTLILHFSQQNMITKIQ